MVCVVDYPREDASGIGSSRTRDGCGWSPEQMSVVAAHDSGRVLALCAICGGIVVLALPVLADTPALAPFRFSGRQLNLHRRCVGCLDAPAWIALRAADLGTP